MNTISVLVLCLDQTNDLIENTKINGDVFPMNTPSKGFEMIPKPQ